MKKFFIGIFVVCFVLLAFNFVNATYKTFNMEVSKYKFTGCKSSDSILVDTLKSNIRLEIYTGSDLYIFRNYSQILAGVIIKDSIDLPDNNYIAKLFTEFGTSYQCLSDSSSFSIITQPPPPPPPPLSDTTKLPDWRKLALVHYSEPSCATPQQESLMARRYSFIDDGGCSIDMNAIWNLTSQPPDWSFYITLTDLNPGGIEDQFIVNYLNSKGVNPEVRFMHYSEATSTSFTDGTAIMAAGDRVPMYTASKTRILRNLDNSFVREATIAYGKGKILEVPFSVITPYRFKALYFDNASSTVLFNWGGINSGGTVAEANLKIQDVAFYTNWYPSKTKLTLELCQDTFDVYNKDVFAFGSSNTDINIMATEYDPSPARTVNGAMLGFYNGFKNLKAINPKFRAVLEQAAWNTGVPTVGEEVAPGVITQANLNEHAFKNDHAVRYLLDPNDSCVSGHSGPYQIGAPTVWNKIQELSMGTRVKPVEPAWKTGTDPLGQTYSIWRDTRVSSNGDTILILMRAKGDWPNWTQGITSRVLVDLGSLYMIYEPSGILIGPASKIYLRNGDTIFLRKSGGILPQPTYDFKKAILR